AADPGGARVPGRPHGPAPSVRAGHRVLAAALAAAPPRGRLGVLRPAGADPGGARVPGRPHGPAPSVRAGHRVLAAALAAAPPRGRLGLLRLLRADRRIARGPVPGDRGLLAGGAVALQLHAEIGR